MMDDVMRSVRDLKRRVFGMLSRAIVTSVDDGRKLQSLQVEALADELSDECERFQDYGFASHPYAEAEALVCSVGGTRSHMVVIVVADRRYRLTGLEQGEVALYDDLGQVVHLKRDGILIKSELKVSIEAERVEVTADQVEVTASQADIIADVVNLGGTGGAGIARVGDNVDPGTHKIISGSDKVFAA